MFFLPRHLQQLFKKKKGRGKRAFAAEVVAPELAKQEKPPERKALTDFNKAWQGEVREGTAPHEFEVFPADPSIRKRWFSLTIREREVAALVCMGYRNYEVASMLGVGYGTVQTHLQNVFYKFDLRSRKEIRAILKSWPAEEWWTQHH